MAIRDKMRESSARFVQPGETIQQVFPGQTASQWVVSLMTALSVIGALVGLFFNRYRIFAVTDQRILVLDAGKWRMSRAKGVVGELPRGTRLGPGTGLWHVIPVDGSKVRVHRRFFKDIEAADSSMSPVVG